MKLFYFKNLETQKNLDVQNYPITKKSLEESMVQLQF